MSRLILAQDGAASTWDPSALRYAGLESALERVGHNVHDRGNVAVPVMERCHVTEPKLRFIDCILEVAQQVADQVQSSLERGHLPLTLGGDHSFSFGSIAGAARVKKLGVIWIDAHGDFNTPDTSPSGNIHGMPLAALCGYGDDRLVHLGNGKTRSIDPANIVNVGAHAIWTMRNGL